MNQRRPPPIAQRRRVCGKCVCACVCVCGNGGGREGRRCIRAGCSCQPAVFKCQLVSLDQLAFQWHHLPSNPCLSFHSIYSPNPSHTNTRAHTPTHFSPPLLTASFAFSVQFWTLNQTNERRVKREKKNLKWKQGRHPCEQARRVYSHVDIFHLNAPGWNQTSSQWKIKDAK